MSWNGSGVFTRLRSWVTDAAASLPISATLMDSDTNDIVAGLNLCLTADGQRKPSANLSMNGFKLTNMAAATTAGDAVRFEQVGVLAAAQGAVPSGTLLDFAGSSAPTGFLLCDGSAVSRATYAALFTAIGTTWGAGDGSTTFNVPDLRRRATIGSGGTAVGPVANTVGAVGGEETHALTVAELAAHNHVINISDPGHAHTDGGHVHPIAAFTNVAGSVGVPSGAAIDALTTQTGTGYANILGNTTGITATSNNNGSGTAHNNMQPSAVVTKIIKT